MVLTKWVKSFKVFVAAWFVTQALALFHKLFFLCVCVQSHVADVADSVQCVCSISQTRWIVTEGCTCTRKSEQLDRASRKKQQSPFLPGWLCPLGRSWNLQADSNQHRDREWDNSSYQLCEMRTSRPGVGEGPSACCLHGKGLASFQPTDSQST